MHTKTRLLGITLLGGLAFATWLFLSGHITFPSDTAMRSARRELPDTSGTGPAWYPDFPASREGPSGPGLPDFPIRSYTRVAPPDADAAWRVASEDGSHALIGSEGTPEDGCGLDERPAYILLRRPEGRPAERWTSRLQQETAGEEVRVPMDDLVEPGDSVLARGHLPFSSLVCVLNDGGFVLVDVRGTSAALVLRFDDTGACRWSHTGPSLFGDAWSATFRDDLLSLHTAHPWQSGTWVDEAREQLVILAWDDRVVTVALDDGRATTAEATPRGLALGESPEAVAIAIERFTRGEAFTRVAALELARRRGWVAAMEPAHTVLRDEGAPEGARLHAALLLADHGDLAGRDLVLAIAQRPLLDTEEWRGPVELAWRHLSRFLGEEAIPLYIERLRPPLSNERRGTVDGEVAGLAALGDAAISPTVDLVLDAERERPLQWHLPELLARLRAGTPRDERRHEPGAGVLDEELVQWDALLASGSPSALQGLLTLQKYGYKTHLWSVLVLPAARWARLHPRPEYADPLGTFRTAFVVEPQCRDGWRDRVLAEVDAAREACGGS